MKNKKFFLGSMKSRLRFRLFLLRKKSASIAFWYQNVMLAGRTLTSMPPAGGELTVELRIVHRRSLLLRGVGRVVPMCAVLQADRASVQVYAT